MSRRILFVDLHPQRVLCRIPGNPLAMIAEVLYEARQRHYAREPELVGLTFEARGTALVPVGGSV